MILYGQRAANPDPCSDERNPTGAHYCRRINGDWYCIYCGQPVKTYTGPSIIDDAPNGR